MFASIEDKYYLKRQWLATGTRKETLYKYGHLVGANTFYNYWQLVRDNTFNKR